MNYAHYMYRIVRMLNPSGIPRTNHAQTLDAYIPQDMLLEKLDHTMIVLNVKICLEIKRAQLI